MEEIATLSLITGQKIVNLGDVAYAKRADVGQLAMALQKRGFGRVTEISGGGDREYHFSVTSMGFEYASEIRSARAARTWLGRLKRTNWNAINAIAASVAAIAALVAAYYSYLSFAISHGQTH